MRVVQISGTVLLLAIVIVLLFLLAVAWVAIKVVLWLLPLLILVIAAWLILRLFHRAQYGAGKGKAGKKKDAVDVEFKIMT
jgi:uncharacterized protein (DUF58 family)